MLKITVEGVLDFKRWNAFETYCKAM